MAERDPDLPVCFRFCQQTKECPEDRRYIREDQAVVPDPAGRLDQTADQDDAQTERERFTGFLPLMGLIPPFCPSMKTALGRMARGV